MVELWKSTKIHYIYVRRRDGCKAIATLSRLEEEGHNFIHARSRHGGWGSCHVWRIGEEVGIFKVEEDVDVVVHRDG